MTNKEIKALLDLIKASGLEEVSLKTDSFAIRVKRSASVSAPAASGAAILPLPPPKEAQTKAPAAIEDEGQTIKSPMIGTFYRAPKPDAPPFVKEGDKVKKGQIICIIEAMKLFNEIEAELSGTVVKVLVRDATAVEYDEPLFLVRPD